MDSTLVLFLGLAVWRMTRMFIVERGPLDLLAKWRARLAKNQKRVGGIYDAVTCFYCLSIWVAMLPSFVLAHNPLTFIGYTLIMSAEAIIINKVYISLL